MALAQPSPQPMPESLRGIVPIPLRRQTAAQLIDERDFWNREAGTMIAQGRLASAELALGFAHGCADELANRSAAE